MTSQLARPQFSSTFVLIRPMWSSHLSTPTPIPVCSFTGHLSLSLLRQYFPKATDLHYYTLEGCQVPVPTAVTTTGQVVFCLPNEHQQYVVSSDEVNQGADTRNDEEAIKQVNLQMLEFSSASKLVREDIIELKQNMEQFREDVKNSVDLIKKDLLEVCKEAQNSVSIGLQEQLEDVRSSISALRIEMNHIRDDLKELKKVAGGENGNISEQITGLGLGHLEVNEKSKMKEPLPLKCIEEGNFNEGNVETNKAESGDLLNFVSLKPKLVKKPK